MSSVTSQAVLFWHRQCSSHLCCESGSAYCYSVRVLKSYFKKWLESFSSMHCS